MGTVVPDVAIAGAGIIGLSLGLELLERGLSVTVMERRRAMSSASAAAGGMLAVFDPQNPRELMPLAIRSGELYPSFLQRIERLSGMAVPLRTRWAIQHVAAARPGATLASAAEVAEFAPGLQMGDTVYEWLEEGSVDPIDLQKALPKAFEAAGGVLLEHAAVDGVEVHEGVRVHTSAGDVIAGEFVNCCGSWAGEPSLGLERLPVFPVKGQMVNLRCGVERLGCVVRAPGIYMIPRGDGRVTVGSTIEDAGFDEGVARPAILGLVAAAQSLLPELEVPAPMSMWAGLRPGTPDQLPILGRAEKKHCWHATGHYRDGILLGPVTARVMAQAIAGEQPEVGLEAYSPVRFAIVSH
jgi:glycine oxidase